MKNSFLPKIKEKLNKTIMGEVVRDRKGEQIQVGLLKEAIDTYVTLSYEDVDIKLDNGVYQWSVVGDNEMKIYDEYFEDPLCQMID